VIDMSLKHPHLPFFFFAATCPSATPVQMVIDSPSRLPACRGIMTDQI
jgi:hypothetical protein